MVKWKYTYCLFEFLGIGNKVGQIEKGLRDVGGYRATAIVAKIHQD